jgi:hypothetical protein
VVYALRVANLLVEQARENEADRGGTSASDKGKHASKTCYGQRGNIRQDQNERRQSSESSVRHGCATAVVTSSRAAGVQQRRARTAIGWLRPARPPVEDGIKRGSAGVDLERDGKEDQHDNGCLADS